MMLFFAGAASMFAVMCALSLWAGLHLAKQATHRPYKHLLTALHEQDAKRAAQAPVASAPCGASAENTRAGAQPAATTAFARPLGASPFAWPHGRNFIVYQNGHVVGTVHAQTRDEAELIACVIHGPTAFVQVYSRASITDMCEADEIDERIEKAMRARHA